MISGPVDEKNFAAIEKLIEKEIPRLDNPITGVEKKAPAANKETEKVSREKAKRPARKKPSDQASERREKPAEAPKAKVAAKEPDSTNRRGRRDKESAMGMGDDLPTFIAKSFDERRAG